MLQPTSSASLTEEFITRNPEFVHQGYEWVYPDGSPDPATDADDFIQDNLLTIHKALSLPFTENTTTLKNRVRIALIFRHINLKRNLSRRPTIEPRSPRSMDEELASNENEKPTENAIEDVEQRGYIKTMLCATLPREQCAVILKYALNYSGNEIAEVLDITPNYAKQIVFRGLRHMRKSTAGQEYQSTYISTGSSN